MPRSQIPIPLFQIILHIFNYIQVLTVMTDISKKEQLKNYVGCSFLIGQTIAIDGGQL